MFSISFCFLFLKFSKNRLTSYNFKKVSENLDSLASHNVNKNFIESRMEMRMLLQNYDFNPWCKVINLETEGIAKLEKAHF